MEGVEGENGASSARELSALAAAAAAAAAHSSVFLFALTRGGKQSVEKGAMSLGKNAVAGFSHSPDQVWPRLIAICATTNTSAASGI